MELSLNLLYAVFFVLHCFRDTWILTKNDFGILSKMIYGSKYFDPMVKIIPQYTCRPLGNDHKVCP